MKNVRCNWISKENVPVDRAPVRRKNRPLGGPLVDRKSKKILDGSLLLLLLLLVVVVVVVVVGLSTD